MNRETIYDGITDVPDELIDEAGRPQKRRPRRLRWAAAVAAVAAVALLAGILLLPGDAVRTVAAAEYPQMSPYPNEMAYVDWATGEFDSDGFGQVYEAWSNDRSAQRAQSEDYKEGPEHFISTVNAQLLSGTEGENRVYSPLNIYLALGMLAELTDGESRAQILSLLGESDMDALRAHASALWNANYCDDGAVTSILAASLWLRDGISFRQNTLDRLADTYYASSFQGTVQDMSKAMRDWLSEQTGGLLDEQTGALEMSPETVLALATTICYKAKWSDTFLEENTQEAVFHSLSGDETCDFMRQDATRDYYWADQFSAVYQSMESAGNMWFLLPDEGVSVDELLSDPQLMEFLQAGTSWEQSKYLVVHLSVPKFDVSSQLNLESHLQSLGVTGVFEPGLADFSPTAKDSEGFYLGQATHAARVVIDEEGCTASAFTAMVASGAAEPPDEEVDFVLDRPFLFVLTGLDGLPLFLGVVNHPVS